MVGMRDVAKKAGVSVSTVSLVVNRTGYVSDEMRDRVTAAMKALDYIPNELARNLYHDRTNIVGVIVPTVRHPFFATLVGALQREFSVRGMRTMLCSTADASTGEAEYVDMLRRHMMDGLVMAAHTGHDPEYWTSIGRPIVAFDRWLGEGIPSVCSDHAQGGRLVAEALVRGGARHVAMIGGPRSQFHDRIGGPAAAAGSDGEVADAGAWEGTGDGARGRGGDTDGGTTFPSVRYYLTAGEELDRAGVRHEYVEAGEVDEFVGYERAARDVVGRCVGGVGAVAEAGSGAAGDAGSDVSAAAEEPVDAVVSSDVGAALCVREALRRGLRVPGDLQVVAYDGTYLADAAGMRLTAVRQDFDAIASLIASRMMEQIEGAAAADDDGEDAGAGSAGEHADSGNGGSVATGARTLPGDVIPVSLRVGDTTR